MVGDTIDTTEIKNVEVTDAELNRLRLHDGDLLFVRTNGNPVNVGRCAAFSEASVVEHQTDKSWIFASYLIRAKLLEDTDPTFAQSYFSSPTGRKAIRERCKTSAGQFNINTDGLGSLPFPIVRVSDQREFASRLNALGETKADPTRHLANSERLFASLQHRAFRGEL